MAEGRKVSDLDDVGAISDTDLMPLVDPESAVGSRAKKVTMQEVRGFVADQMKAQTGGAYGAPTGTASRTTFDTDTASLLQVARHVKALMDDLAAAGLITVTAGVTAAPTAITLSNATVTEKSPQGQLVGTLAADQPGCVFTLLSGDISFFQIDAATNALQCSAVPLVFADAAQRSITIRATNSAGSFDLGFVINVLETSGTNNPPYDITSTQNSVVEGTAVGTVITTLAALDLDAGDTHTFALATDSDYTFGGRFQLVNNQILVGSAGLTFSTTGNNTYGINVVATDNGTPPKSFTKTIAITVTQAGQTGGSGATNVNTPTVNDYAAASGQAKFAGVPFPVPGFDMPVGRISTNPLRLPASVPGCSVGTLGSTAAVQITQLGTYQDVDFRGYMVYFSAALANTDPSKLIFDNCLFGNGGGFDDAGTIGMLNDNWALGAHPRVDCTVRWCTFDGGKTSACPAIAAFSSAFDVIACKFTNFNESAIRNRGGVMVWNDMRDFGWQGSGGGHLDCIFLFFGSWFRDVVVARNAIDISVQTAAYGGTTGAITPRAGSATRPMIAEENVIYSNGAVKTIYDVQADSTVPSTALIRFLVNYFRDWTGANAWTGDGTYYVFQDNFNINGGSAVAMADSSGIAAKPGQPSVAYSSSATGAITYTPTLGTADSIDIRYRIKGEGYDRWKWLQGVTGAATITGLDATKIYEFQHRAVDAQTTTAHSTGSPAGWSQKSLIQPDAAGAATDTTPDAFAFTDVTGSAVSAVNTSNTITIAGLGAGVSVPVTFSGSGGYKKNGAAVSTAATTAQNGDTFAIELTSSSSNSATVSGTLNVNGVSDTYSVSTVSASGAITLRAFGTTGQSAVGTGSGETLTASPGLPVGLAAGDLMLMFVEVGGGDTTTNTPPDLTVPPGWSRVTWTSYFGQVASAIYAKIAGAGETAPDVTQHSGEANSGSSGNAILAVIGAWSGGQGLVEALASVNGSSAAAQGSSLTANGADRYRVDMVASGRGAAAATGTAAAGYTERAEVSIASADFNCLSVYTKDAATTGAGAVAAPSTALAVAAPWCVSSVIIV